MSQHRNRFDYFLLIGIISKSILVRYTTLRTDVPGIFVVFFAVFVSLVLFFFSFFFPFLSSFVFVLFSPSMYLGCWRAYGLCNRNVLLRTFFPAPRYPGTRISWSRGLLGKRKIALKSSSQRGEFHSFFFVSNVVHLFMVDKPLKFLSFRLVGTHFRGQMLNISTGNGRSQNLPGLYCFRF